MEPLILNLFRTYEKDRTTGKLYVDGKFFDNTLEDVGRPPGIKIQDETCFPEGVYQMDVNWSPRFATNMIIIFNAAGQAIERLGVRFTGIRAHAGVKTSHTAGCLLLQRYMALLEIVQEAIGAGRKVYLVVSGALP